MKIKPCKFCGFNHGVLCPQVKAVEYFPSGKIKRVEFKCAGDVMQPVVVPPGPLSSRYTYPPVSTWGVSDPPPN